MRVMVMVKATKTSEAGLMPSDPGFAKLLEDMGRFNEELVKAGVVLAADGLHPSHQGIEAEEFGEEFARGKEERMRVVERRTRS